MSGVSTEGGRTRAGTWPEAPPRAAAVSFLVAGAVASAYLWRTDPHQPGHPLPLCPLRAVTGLQCPACGGTRMAYDLLHGDLVRAWHDNALLLLLSPLLLWLLGRWTVAGLRGRAYRFVLPAWGGPVLLVTGLGWAVLRNAV